MGWWKDFTDARARDSDNFISIGLREWEQYDKDLEKQRGLMPALLRGIVKAMRFIIYQVFRVGAAIFPNALPGVEALVSGRVLEIPKPVWDATIDKIASSIGLDADGVRILKSYYQSFSDASPIVQGLALISIYSTMISYVMGPGLGKVLQTMSVKMRPSVPAPGEVMGARALDPALDAKIWDVCRRNGLRDADIEVMFAATYSRIPIDMIREAYYRHDMGEPWAVNRLQELGFTPERCKELMSTWELLPSMGDMVLFMAHEAFEPDKIRRFGLDAETPGMLLEYAAKLGLSKEAATWFWISHWVHPGLQTVLDMYHRGIIKWEDVYEYMSIVELPPYWRDKIREAAYRVITRVDARRMYGTGTIDQPELFKIYLSMGYSPEDSLRLVDFTIKYESGLDKDVSKDDIVRAYSYRDISRGEAIAYLTRVGFMEDAANFYLDRVDLDKTRERLKTAITLIKDKYTGNLITEGEAYSGLVSLGLKPDAISDQVNSWKIIAIKNTKLPSKTDLDKFLRNKLIGEVEYRGEMTKLGYSQKYTDLYFQYVMLGKGGEESE